MSFPSNKGLAQIEEEFAIDAGEEADAYSKLSNLLSVSLPMIFETLETVASDENLRDRGGGEKKGKREDPWEKAFSIFLTDSLISLQLSNVKFLEFLRILINLFIL